MVLGAPINGLSALEISLSYLYVNLAQTSKVQLTLDDTVPCQ